MKTCSVEGCNGKHKAKGYCNKHYIQMKRRGKILDRSIKDPNEIIEYDDHAEIVMYNKQHEETGRAIIDLDDVDKVKNYKWYLKDKGYVYSKTLGILLHRFIMDPHDDMVVDHINHDPLDNRKSNLRICTKQQNNMNKSLNSNNMSGVSGVYWNKQINRWIAQIKLYDEQIYIGSYKTIEAATQARKNAEIEYFGEYRNQDED